MAETGFVIEADDSFVTVRMTRTEACAQCRACTMGMQKEEMRLRAQNLCGAHIGDTVEIALEEGAFLRAAAILYILPLGLLVLGLAGGHYLFGLFMNGILRDLLTFAAGVSLMLPGFLLIRRNEHKYKQGRFTPLAVALVQNTQASANVKSS